MKYAFSKVWGPYYKWQRRSLVSKSVLVKLHVFNMNGNDWGYGEFCDGICF